MIDEDLTTAEQRLNELNQFNTELRLEIEQHNEAIQRLSLEMQTHDVARQKAEMERRAVKAEYSELHERVGIERKAREAANEKPE